jgi:hypothetical protein
MGIVRASVGTWQPSQIKIDIAIGATPDLAFLAYGSPSPGSLLRSQDH